MSTLEALQTIFVRNVLPLLLLMALGWFVQRRVGLDMKTLSRLNMHIFVPALTVVALSRADLPASSLFRVVGFVLALQFSLFWVARGWSRTRGYSVGLSSAFACALIFYNSGNFGYPLIALLFGERSTAVGLQAMVLAVQNATTFSLGQVIIRGPQVGVWPALREYFRLPFPYALGLGLVLQRTGWRLPGPLGIAVELAAGGLVPIALVTLGAQLALVRWSRRLKPVAAACVLRLWGGPLLAYVLLRLLGWQGVLAQQLLISSAVPTAVNTSLLAVEFENEPDFAAQVVMTTTLLSALTLTVVIHVARLLFPV